MPPANSSLALRRSIRLSRPCSPSRSSTTVAAGNVLAGRASGMAGPYARHACGTSGGGVACADVDEARSRPARPGHRHHRRQLGHRQGGRGRAGRHGRDGRDHRPEPGQGPGRARRRAAAFGQQPGRAHGPRPGRLRLHPSVRNRAARALRPARRAREQRRGDHLRPGAHRPGLRDDVRRQPPRALPAHRAAARSAGPERALAGGQRGLDRPPVRARGSGLRGPPERPLRTTRWTPTRSPSWPTSCSATSWPAGSRAPASPRTRCTPVVSAPGSASRTTTGASSGSP